MTILLVGGGTGGHITPLLAVAHELKKKKPNVRVIAVVDAATSFARLLEESDDIADVYRIKAGKYRRYPNQAFIQKITDIKTLLLNTRDFFRTLIGVWQANRLLKMDRPHVIFIKGGFVAVPVGLAAHMKKIPFITHDSDAEPGLANRIVGRYAEQHAVGFDPSLYTYPMSKTKEVGVPISNSYKPVTPKEKAIFRNHLGLPEKAKVLLVVGGSQGSVGLNNLVTKILPDLLQDKNLYIIHQTGAGKKGADIESDRYINLEFIPDIYVYTGAADVVLTRAGSFVAELSAQKKAVILVPAPQLAGSHQLKNADFLAQKDAVIVISEKDATMDARKTSDVVTDLINDKRQQVKLGGNLYGCFKHSAAKDIATMIYQLEEQA